MSLVNCNFNTLPIPVECAIHVFSYLPLNKIRDVQLVCREWRAISNLNELWKEFSQRGGIDLSQPSRLPVKLQYYNSVMEKKMTWEYRQIFNTGARVHSLQLFSDYQVLVGDEKGCVTLYNFWKKKRKIFSHKLHDFPVAYITVLSNEKFISECSAGIKILWSHSQLKTTMKQVEEGAPDYRQVSLAQLSDGRKISVHTKPTCIVLSELVLYRQRANERIFI